MIVYLVRHGESEGNETKKHQSPDTPLSKKGIKQAGILARRLKKLPIDVVYASHWVRAKQTAEIISKSIKKPVEYWEDLREISFPSELWNMSYENDKSKVIRKLIKKNWDKGNWKYSDEETFDELAKRADEVLKNLLAHHKGQSVLCVSHGTMIGMMVAKMVFAETLTPAMFWRMRYHFISGNTGITECWYSKDRGWTLTTWNDTTHL